MWLLNIIQSINLTYLPLIIIVLLRSSPKAGWALMPDILPKILLEYHPRSNPIAFSVLASHQDCSMVGGVRPIKRRWLAGHVCGGEVTAGAPLEEGNQLFQFKV